MGQIEKGESKRTRSTMKFDAKKSKRIDRKGKIKVKWKYIYDTGIHPPPPPPPLWFVVWVQIQ